MVKIQRNDTYNLIVEGKSKGIDEIIRQDSLV